MSRRVGECMSGWVSESVVIDKTKVSEMERQWGSWILVCPNERANERIDGNVKPTKVSVSNAYSTASFSRVYSLGLVLFNIASSTLSAPVRLPCAKWM